MRYRIAHPSTDVSEKKDDIFVADAKYCPVTFTPEMFTVSL